MTESGFGACPDAATLAAFAEGRLAEPGRGAVGHHVGRCPDCVSVVGVVGSFLDEVNEIGSPERAQPPRGWWTIAAAVVAISLSFALWRMQNPGDPAQRIRAISAGAELRPVEGRLYGFQHARFDIPRGSERPPSTIALRAEGERLVRLSSTPEVMHARGLAALLAGDTQRAEQLLRDAAQGSPRNHAVWNDLAVANIAKGTVGDDAAFHAAVRAASYAARLDPASASPHFNRGVALEHLGFAKESAKAFREAAVRESSAEWREEIRQRIVVVERHD